MKIMDVLWKNIKDDRFPKYEIARNFRADENDALTVGSLANLFQVPINFT